MEEQEFGWDEPNSPKTVHLQFNLMGRYHYIVISMEQMNQVQNVEDTQIFIQT
jgi:hypothetical protein